MKKFLLLLPAIAFLSYSAQSQSTSTRTTDATTVEGPEYIPVGGHSDKGVPSELQGIWLLKTGLKPGNNPSNLNIESKRPAPGTETRRDSITTTRTINGVTHTTTEVEIERTGTPEKQITPPQGTKMHTPQKPSISFYGLNQTFSGFTGCNKFSGRYNMSGNKITFKDASASTKMVCIGDANEEAFLSTLKSVNSFRAGNGRLELMRGDDVLLVFERK